MFEKNRVEDGTQCFERAMRLASSSTRPGTQCVYATALAKLGEQEQAEKLFEKAFAKHPKDGFVRLVYGCFLVNYEKPLRRATVKNQNTMKTAMEKERNLTGFSIWSRGLRIWWESQV